jgi:hypothetical protein
MTGTTGSAFAAGGIGAIYTGAINNKSTNFGNGSGQWINFSVPFAGATGTSCYGSDVLSSSKGGGGVGNVALVGTWTNNVSDNILGFYYKGSLRRLKHDSPGSSGFQSFQAVTGSDASANYTYLHSLDGRYAVGNFTTSPGFYVNLFLNSGPGSGSYVYIPRTNTQKPAIYQDQYTFHTLFGIWHNRNKSYTVSGGGSNEALLSIYSSAHEASPGAGQGLPPDAAFGRGMLADVDPLTGAISNQKYYNFQNDPSDLVLTHFQGIYYAGKGVYEVPFDAITSGGDLSVGIAYIKRLDDGSFSDNALWQVFPAPAIGVLTSNDSVAAAGSVGELSDPLLSSFASFSETKSYLTRSPISTIARLLLLCSRLYRS